MQLPDTDLARCSFTVTDGSVDMRFWRVDDVEITEPELFALFVELNVPEKLLVLLSMVTCYRLMQSLYNEFEKISFKF